MKSSIYKEDYSFQQLLSASWDIFTQKFGIILIILFLSVIPANTISETVKDLPLGRGITSMFLLVLISIIAWGISMLSNLALAFYVKSCFDAKTLLVLISIIAWGISMLSNLALAFYVKSCFDAKTISINDAFSMALRRWQPAITTSILMGLLLIPAFICLIIPGVVFAVYWSFALYSVALAERSGMKALEYSKSVVGDRWGYVFGYYILINLIILVPVVLLLITMTAAAASLRLNEGMLELLAIDVGVSIIGAILTSFFTVFQIVLFLNYESSMKRKSHTAKGQKLSDERLVEEQVVL